MCPLLIKQLHAKSGPLSTLENRGMEESEGLMLKVRLERDAGAAEPQGTSRRCAFQAQGR